MIFRRFLEALSVPPHQPGQFFRAHQEAVQQLDAAFAAVNFGDQQFRRREGHS